MEDKCLEISKESVKKILSSLNENKNTLHGQKN